MKTETKIKLASLASRGIRRLRTSLGKPNLAVFHRNGLDWELDLTQGIDFAIFLQGAFEPGTLREYAHLVRPGDTVFDIGANIGAHTLPLAQLVGAEGSVVAFEPTDYAFKKLQKNMALNPSVERRINAVQALLVGDATQTKPSSVPSSWSLAAPAPGEIIHPVHKGTFNSVSGATAFPLDEWVAKNNITRLDFVKIDVDGFEVDVLEGATETLDRFRPRIIMEFSPYVFEERGRSFKELLSILRQNGYEAREVRGRRLDLTDELEQTIPHGTSINVILRTSDGS